MATPRSPEARVCVRHLPGAGYALPAHGVAFRTSDVLEVSQAQADALVAAYPHTIVIETAPAAEKETG